jgi:predicted DNA-binding ribbon-helix-helix protein
MKSSVVERSRVSVEDAFWKGLREIIAKRRDEPLSDRQFANLSSAIRLFALGFYRNEQGGMVATRSIKFPVMAAKIPCSVA